MVPSANAYTFVLNTYSHTYGAVYHTIVLVQLYKLSFMRY